MAGAGSRCISIIDRIRIIFFFDDDHLCFAVGDVSGKGVPASLFMAVTRTLFRSTAGKAGTPGEILARLNMEIYRDNESCMFVTLFCGILNIRTGQVDCSNGGHNPPQSGRQRSTLQSARGAGARHSKIPGRKDYRRTRNSSRAQTHGWLGVQKTSRQEPPIHQQEDAEVLVHGH